MVTKQQMHYDKPVTKNACTITTCLVLSGKSKTVLKENYQASEVRTRLQTSPAL